MEFAQEIEPEQHTELKAHKQLSPDAIRTVIGLWRLMRRVYDNHSRVHGDVAVADDG
jgi:hypothetical protein